MSDATHVSCLKKPWVRPAGHCAQPSEHSSAAWLPTAHATLALRLALGWWPRGAHEQLELDLCSAKRPPPQT